MARDKPINVWNEVRVTAEGISITLLSESSDSGAVVEDETWFTFAEMEEMSPSSPITLNLSDETAQSLNWEQKELQELFDEAEQDLYYPDEGDVLVDDNPAPWSEDTRVVVDEVLDNVPARHYVVGGTSDKGTLKKHLQSAFDKTVADANPKYPTDDAVILGHYEGGTKQYAFPESRLVEDSRTRSSQQ